MTAALVPVVVDDLEVEKSRHYAIAQLVDSQSDRRYLSTPLRTQGGCSVSCWRNVYSQACCVNLRDLQTEFGFDKV
jgi:hypothetical protein